MQGTRPRPDRINECHRLFIAAASPGNPGLDGAGANVRTVPGFSKEFVGRLPMRINQLAGWLRHASQSVLSARRECLRVGKRDVFSVQIRYQPLRRNHGRTQSLSLIFSAPLIAIFRILKLPNLSTHETNSCNLFHQFHAVIIEFIYIVVNIIVDNNIDVSIPQTVHSDTQVVPIAALKPVLVVNRPAGRTPNGRRATQFE